MTARGCVCCGNEIVQLEHPDPWGGDLDAFCWDCRLGRCDTSDGECVPSYPAPPSTPEENP